MINTDYGLGKGTLSQSGVNNTSSGSAQLFATLLQMQMNQKLTSIADFSDSSSTLMGGNSSGGLFGSQDTSSLILMALLLSGNNNGLSGQIGNMLLSNQTGTGVYGGVGASYQRAANAYTSSGVSNIPAAAWKEATAGLTSVPGRRNASLYAAVMNQFNVENHQRYAINKMGNNDTYCNIYAWDVTKAMGAEIPHYVDSNNQPTTSSAKGARAVNANGMNNWLNSSAGKANGWRKVSAQEAQMLANQGYPAVASWKNPSGHGHISMVAPSKDGRYDSSRGVAISQAGADLIQYGYISQVYKKSALKNVEYFVHA